jgi:TIR domain
VSGGVFICYRREDSAGFAGRIYDRLIASLGRESVFIDVDGIPAGRDFVEVLSERVGRCDALIALIGQDWLASKDKENRRRLDDPGDFVRIEIEAALDRNVRVIPVLVDGAAMPSADDLPQQIKKLARRQGIEISHSRFDSDAERLTEALAQIDPPALASSSRRAAAARTLATPKRSAVARWAIPVVGLVIAAAGAAIVYEPRRPREHEARQEETAPRAGVKSTSDVLKTLPIPDTMNASNVSAQPSQSKGAAAPQPLDNAPNAAARNGAADEPSTASLAPDVATKISKGDAPDASTGPQEWMNLLDFKNDYRERIVSSYPDKAWARCQDGIPQRAAHWSPRPPHQFFDLRGMYDKAFKSDAVDMTAKVFKILYDNVYQGCDGAKQHQTLWMKEG